jgi:hypothetical protein
MSKNHCIKKRTEAFQAYADALRQKQAIEARLVSAGNKDQSSISKDIADYLLILANERAAVEMLESFFIEPHEG